VGGFPKSAGWHELFREAGGTKLAKVASRNLICPSDEARRRIRRVADFGFEEILTARNLAQSRRSSACAI
jgi:hypothetical protein